MLKPKFSSLALISILVLMATISISTVNAQSTTTVTVNTATGGLTDVTGTQTYPDGTQVTITATPNSDFAFSQWTISPSDGSGDIISTDNPVTFTVTGGVTYTVSPSFVVPIPIPGLPMPTNLATAAIIVIYPSAGGSTNPPAGTYALADATAFNLKATANSGWQFSHWTICGTNASHGTTPVNWDPTDNPYNVNHGYGDTYRYQAVFTPVGSTQSPTPTPTSSTTAGTVAGMSSDQWIIIVLVVVIVVVLIAFGVYAARRKK